MLALRNHSFLVVGISLVNYALLLFSAVLCVLLLGIILI